MTDCQETGLHLSSLLAGDLSPEELAALEAHQAGCAGCRTEIERLLWQDRALSEMSGAGQVDAMKLRLRSALAPRRRFPWPVAVAAAALVALMFGASYLLFREPNGVPQIAEVTPIQGKVDLLTPGGVIPVTMDSLFPSGYGVRLTGAESRATVTLVDGSRLDLEGDVTIRSITDTRVEEPGEKHSELRFFVLQGSIRASVAKQPANRAILFSSSHGLVRVIGTELRVDVVPESMRVEVSEGLVEFTRRSDGQSVEVSGGHYAVVAADQDLAPRAFRLPPRGKAFTDITADCGLEALRKQKPDKWWLSGVHFVDLDGDGTLDFFMSGHGGGSLGALNDGKGIFTPAAGILPESEIHLAADTAESGRINLSVTYHDGGGRWWNNNSKPGMPDFLAGPVTRDGGQARQQALIDLNRDGKIDWLRGAGSGVQFDFGDGTGRFEAKSGALPNPGTDGISVIPVDLDGDGFIDFIVQWGRYDYEPGRTRIYRNDGKMNFTDVTVEAGLYEDGLGILGIGDVNQDGHVDLIGLEKKTFPHTIFLNDGKGHFTKSEGAITGYQGRPTYVSWGMAVMTDLDNDGIPDLLVTGRNYLKMLRGTGGGKFVYMNKDWGVKDIAEAAVDSGFAFGDINGDGMLDLVGYKEIHPVKTFTVYRNDLPVQNWINVRPIGAAGNKIAAGAKIRVTAAGTKDLLWYEPVTIWCKQSQQSYYAYAETERHFGLGARGEVDVAVEFYPSGKVVKKAGVKANTTIKISED